MIRSLLAALILASPLNAQVVSVKTTVPVLAGAPGVVSLQAPPLNPALSVPALVQGLTPFLAPALVPVLAAPAVPAAVPVQGAKALSPLRSAVKTFGQGLAAIPASLTGLFDGAPAVGDSAVPAGGNAAAPASIEDPARRRLLMAKGEEMLADVEAEVRVRPNFSDFHVAATVELSDGRWFKAGNLELSRELTLCAERAAILRALGVAAGDMTVRTVVVANSRGEHKKLCAECLTWLSTDKFFTPDTEIVSVARDGAGGALSLKRRPVKAVVPFHAGYDGVPSVSASPARSLELVLSPRAALATKAAGLTSSALSKLMGAAQRAYADGAAKTFSDKPAAAALTLSPFGAASAVRFRWAARFTQEEDLQAASAAIQKTTRRQAALARAARSLDRLTGNLLGIEGRLSGLLKPPKIKAIAYYGEDTALPAISGFGRLVKRGATRDTLILKIQGGAVVVRTLDEYMTEIYGLD
jgi:cytidine deaminase